MSSFSVDKGVLDACELSDVELSDGESRPELRTGCLLGAAGGGARFLPVPSTRPPPRVLRAAMALAGGLAAASMARDALHGGVDGRRVSCRAVLPPQLPDSGIAAHGTCPGRLARPVPG